MKLLSKYLIIIAANTFYFLFSHQVIASQHPDIKDDPRIANVKKITTDFFIGEGVSVRGEKLYFGMEKITEINQKDLELFLKVTSTRCNSNRGAFTVTAKLYQQSLVTKKPLTYEQESDIAKKTVWGFSEPEEYYAFLKEFYEGRTMENLKKLSDRIGDIVSASSHMYCELGDYIAYISSKPIKAPLNWYLKDFTVKNYLEHNPNLIALVGCRLLDTNPDEFENRGIMKTVRTIFNGSHPHSAIPLHGFTAAVCKKFFSKKTFTVRANINMTDILKSQLTEDEYEEFYAAPDTGFKIAVDVLIKFYSGEQN